MDVNHKNDVGEAPIHTLVRKVVGKKNSKKEKDNALECVWTFLVYCDNSKFDVDIQNEVGSDTALHIAAEVSMYTNLMTMQHQAC